MNFTIINDCKDPNAVGRQMSRASSLLNGNGVFIGVGSDLEAAGNLIDILDAYGDAEAVILVNVAPRNGSSKKWGNGTPFGYFRYKNSLVVSSIEGLTLSLVKKAGLVKEIFVMDIPTVAKVWVKEGFLDEETGSYIAATQFRSFDFVPRAAAYLIKHASVVSETHPIDSFPDAPSAVWWIDNFGNAKTTILLSEGEKPEGLGGAHAALPFVPSLKDVADDTPALTRGSSGIGEKRFLEIAVQGKSAAQRLGLSSGTILS
jgi:hypothetical protein